MKYLSTRDKMTHMDAAEAILTGLSRDGGLLTPESIPEIGEDFLRELAASPTRSGQPGSWPCT